MEIIEQIGSYAGLAAVVGLAVLSALYFSQARDVRRLREWAGRGPERAGEPAAAQPQRVAGQPAAAKPAVAKPVPQAPGQATQPGATPAPATAAAAAAAGAAPATVSGPAVPAAGAATPAGARAAEQEGVSQDTVVHPPPASADDEDDADGAGDAGTGEGDGTAAVDDAAAVGPATAAATGAAAGAAAGHEADDDDEHFGDAEEAGLDDEDEDLLEDDAPDPGDDAEGDVEDEDEDDGDDGVEEDDGYDEDTGDRPAVAAPNLPPSRPLTAAGARRPVPPPALPPRSAPPGRGNATGPILPPYAKSRPGGVPDAGSQEPSGRRTAIMAIVGGLLLLVGVGFGAMQLLGEDDQGAQPADQASQQQNGSAGGDGGSQGGSGRQRAAVDPGSVTVAVLNGTTVPGLAAQIGDSIEGQGFQLGTITNSTDQQRAESVVLYAPGAEDEARDVARRLNISQREEADPDSQGLAGDATVIVVAGQDKTR